MASGCVVGNRHDFDSRDFHLALRSRVAGLLSDKRQDRRRRKISQVPLQQVPSAREHSRVARRHAFTSFNSRQRETNR